MACRFVERYVSRKRKRDSEKRIVERNTAITRLKVMVFATMSISMTNSLLHDLFGKFVNLRLINKFTKDW